jgi:predicted dehydrogenase
MTDHRIALIGSRGHWQASVADIPNLQNAMLVAFCPAGDNADRVMDWCEKNGQAPMVEDDYRKMLDRAQADIAIVCGPFEQHAAMCIEAISRGIHVLSEKPAALTFEELEALRAAHQRNPAAHLAGMMFSRYTPGFYTAARRIREGAIGDARLINARKSYRLGQRPPYYRDRKTYGGTIPWVGSHAIDWAMWFAGDAKFTTVAAMHSSAQNDGNGTMERAAVCQFTLTGDRAASISIDVFRPATAPTHDDDWARIVGTEGIIEVRPTMLTVLGSSGANGLVEQISCDTTLLRDFIDHVEGKVKSMLNAESTLALTDACLRARQAADERKIVGFA